jgi:hypothetical protein
MRRNAPLLAEVPRRQHVRTPLPNRPLKPELWLVPLRDTYVPGGGNHGRSFSESFAVVGRLVGRSERCACGRRPFVRILLPMTVRWEANRVMSEE